MYQTYLDLVLTEKTLHEEIMELGVSILKSIDNDDKNEGFLRMNRVKEKIDELKTSLVVFEADYFKDR